MHVYVLYTIVMDYVCRLALVAFSETEHADAKALYLLI